MQSISGSCQFANGDLFKGGLLRVQRGEYLPHGEGSLQEHVTGLTYSGFFQFGRMINGKIFKASSTVAEISSQENMVSFICDCKAKHIPFKWTALSRACLYAILTGQLTTQFINQYVQMLNNWLQSLDRLGLKDSSLSIKVVDTELFNILTDNPYIVLPPPLLVLKHLEHYFNDHPRTDPRRYFTKVRKMLIPANLLASHFVLIQLTCEGELVLVRVYDSSPLWTDQHAWTSIQIAMKSLVRHMFGCDIRMEKARCMAQKGFNDCGAHVLAYLRHLVNKHCFGDDWMQPERLGREFALLMRRRLADLLLGISLNPSEAGGWLVSADR